MSDFDWGSQESAEGDGFDWGSQENAEKSSKAETAIMHGLQGATGNFLDELSGAGEAAGRVIGVKGLGGSFADVGLAEGGPTLKMDILKMAYENARNRKRATLDKQAKDNPGIAATSNVVGAVASPLNKAVKGLSLARGGAVLGGVNALGASDADDLGGMAVDTATGAVLGLGLGKAVDKASPYVQAGAEKAGKALREGAKGLMARTLGAERGTIKSLGIDKVKDAAAQMLDKGNVGVFSSTDDLIAKNQALKSEGGELMGRAYNAIDDAGASTFNPLEVAGKVDEQIGGFYRSPINRGETNQLENTLESILMRGEGNIPLREAQILKEELGTVANWKNNLNITDKEKMAREAYRIVSKQIDDAVQQGGAAIDRAGLTDVLKQGKEIYSRASTAEKLLTNKQAREQGNSLLGLTDAMTGVGALGYGGTTGDWGTAGGIMLAKKGAQRYGTQAGALALNKMSKILMQTPRFAELAQRNPPAFNALATSMAQRMGKQAPRAAEFDPKERGSDQQAREAFLDQ